MGFLQLGADGFSKNLPGSFWTPFLNVFGGSGGALGDHLGSLGLALGAPGITLHGHRGPFGVSGERF